MDPLKPNDRPDPLRRALTLSALGLAGGGTALGLSGCGGDDDHHHNGGDGGNGGSQSISTLRFANGTDVDPINFLIDGNTVYTGLAAGGQVSTFGEVAPGNVIIAARAPSGPPDLASVATTLAVDRFTSVVVHGLTTGASIKLTVFEETDTQPAAGSTRIRVFHAAATIPGGLNVFFTALAESNLPPTPTFALGTYQGLSTFQTLDSSASYRIRITQAATGDLLFDTQSASGITFASRSVVTLVIVPSKSGSSVNLSALPEQAEGGQVGRVL